MDNRRVIVRRIVSGILAVPIIIIGAGLIKDIIFIKRAQDEYKKLAEMVQTAEASKPDPEAAEKTYISPFDFDKLLQMNPDTVGWIRIEDTNVDYPIVQTTDNDKYLHTDFEGGESIAGAIYLDYESEAAMEGRNNVIYGHNMKNGSMFKDVLNYKDEAFFQDHRFFTIYTPEKEIRLKVMAAYYGEAKPIMRKTRFKTQESFDAFVQEMLRPCEYAEKPEGSVSTLYTLITCSYENNDARTFLFAVPVDENDNIILANPASYSQSGGETADVN